jgi:hypothetical protein
MKEKGLYSNSDSEKSFSTAMNFRKHKRYRDTLPKSHVPTIWAYYGSSVFPGVVMQIPYTPSDQGTIF